MGNHEHLLKVDCRACNRAFLIVVRFCGAAGYPAEKGDSTEYCCPYCKAHGGMEIVRV